MSIARPSKVLVSPPPCARCRAPIEQAGKVWGFDLCDLCFVRWGVEAPGSGEIAKAVGMHVEGVAQLVGPAYEKWTAAWVKRGVAG